MHDLPSVTLLQQSHAVPKSGEALEVLGKEAAKKYINGGCSTLNEAVVETVKQSGLSPEQVKRVVEFTNVNAYLTEFNKEGSQHKYVEFHGGPADPAEVLRDLNDGGGGTVFDRGLADYSHDPEPQKTASLLEKNQAFVKSAAVRIGGPTMRDIAGDMEDSASKRYQGPAYAGLDPFGEAQKRMRVRMLSEMTGRSPIVVKHANFSMDPGFGYAQPSLNDETRGMFGETGGEMASEAPLEEDQNAAPQGAPVPGGYDPLQDHMKLMRETVKLMQLRSGATKMASMDFSPGESMLEQAFNVADEPYEFADPLSDSVELRDKLAGAADHLTSELSEFEGSFRDTLEQLYHEVKVAALDGTELGQILAAWQQVVPEASYVKTAFSHIGPRLYDEGVFPSLDAIGASLEKTAHEGLLNIEHPLVSVMADYCQVLSKLAEVRAARDEIVQERNRLDFFVKKAAGLVPKVLRGFARAGEVAGRGAQGIAGEFVENPETAQLIGKGIQKAVTYAPHVGTGVAGLALADEALDRAKTNPAVQFAASRIRREVPGTPEYYNQKAREQSARMQGGYY